MDIVPDDFVAKPRCRRKRYVAVWIQRVARPLQVRMARVVVEAWREQALFVILAGGLAGRSEHLQVAESGHVDFAAEAIRLTHDRRLASAGDAAAVDIHAAHIRSTAQDPLGASEHAARGDFWRQNRN